MTSEDHTRTILITGAASGIGLASRRRLEAGGATVIGADMHEDADITINLGTIEGRRSLVEQAIAMAPNGIDGLVVCAGIAQPIPATLSVNYFGAVATLEGLRPLLLRSARPRAVVMASSVSIYPGKEEIIAACLAGDEPRALALAADAGDTIYVTSKRALARWMRRAAVSPEWGGEGILLNAVGPGVVETPMSAPVLRDQAMMDIIARTNPQVPNGLITADEIAGVIEYLVNYPGRFLLGQLIFVDGGTEAIKRTDLF